jgi:multiple sugar transport system substrate-binding protein
MQKRYAVGLVAIGAALAIGVSAQNSKTPVLYWQYQFDSKVNFVNELMAEFNQANPDIEVKQETFPYDSYIAKVKSAVGAGQGPDVANLFYGWIPDWVAGGYLQALPKNSFNTKTLEASVGPLFKAGKVDNQYWAVPTAVRTLAIFYNKDLFKANGISKIPKTWAEFEAAGKKIQKIENGKTTTAGIAIQAEAQDHHLFREVLSRQWGGKPYTGDFKQITYNSAVGLEAFKWYTGLIERGAATRGKDMFPGSNNAYRDAFISGRAGMIVDGSFAIGSIRNGAKFNWGVFELPTREPGGLRANFGSYWVHGLTPNAKGAKLEASTKWIKFLTSEPVQRRWLQKIGEIPANATLASDPTLRKDPVFGPFVASLPFARATFFVDEAGQRKAIQDAVESVWLAKVSPADALKAAAADEQKLVNLFFKK